MPGSLLLGPLGSLVLACIFEIVALLLGLCLGRRGVLGWGIDSVQLERALGGSDEVVLSCDISQSPLSCTKVGHTLAPAGTTTTSPAPTSRSSPFTIALAVPAVKINVYSRPLDSPTMTEGG